MTDEQPQPTTIRHQAAQWLARREAGDWSDEAQARCASWRAADPRHERAWQRATQLWQGLDATLLAEPAPPIARWRRVPALRPGGWAALAAVLMLALLGAPDMAVRLRADALTSVGERRAVPLPDGSVALLNTDSAIEIEATNGRTIRLLRGEAAFTVAPDAAHPFTVLSGRGSTTALGTRFIVRRQGDGTLVTVTQHKVRVAEGARAQLLREGEQLTYGPAGISRPHAVDIDDADAWMRGHLRVVNMPLGAVVAQLNRYHRGYIGVSEPDLARRPVSGVFDIDDPVAAVDVIERTLGLGSTRLTDHLILIHR